MSDNKLKPCPFCGAELERCEEENLEDIFEHPENGCILNGFMVADYERDIIRWNTRKPMDWIVEKLEEFAECKDCNENGISEKFYYGQGCKACMWKKIIDIVRGERC